MSNAPKTFTEMSDEELLTLLVRAELPPSEKARVVLAVRERKVAERQNFYLIMLTVIMTLATLVQAAGVAMSFKADPANLCQCSPTPTVGTSTAAPSAVPLAPLAKAAAP